MKSSSTMEKTHRLTFGFHFKLKSDKKEHLLFITAEAFIRHISTYFKVICNSICLIYYEYVP